jgi:GNAT superfamily N-acetyltransferase
MGSGGARLRAARPDESDVVADVHAASATVAFAHIYGGEPFPLARTRERWRTFADRIVVADEAGRVVGFAAFDDAELHALYVLPERQGRGLGDRLLAAAGPVGVLWVLEGNARGRRFYERRGWRPDGTARMAFGAPELRYRAGPAGTELAPGTEVGS